MARGMGALRRGDRSRRRTHPAWGSAVGSLRVGADRGCVHTGTVRVGLPAGCRVHDMNTAAPTPPSPPSGAECVGVVGLWHLGCVTAACLAQVGYEVVGIDPDAGTVEDLQRGRPPLYEPGLGELIADCSARLRFATDPRALADARWAWVAFDTPVDDEDRADVEWVMDESARLLAALPEGALVVVSSQMPVGSVAALRDRCAAARGDGGLRFACVPENLRLGNALESFRSPERIVAGVSDGADRRELAE